ncbi:hypothetical protein PYW07_001738 [Mythimna separata]|uniref:Reverse transcriptase domain-containing protein n=1 Tax=Mythimna separata TaxID=271217 RepID=A0AAD7YUY0_MYTSE|nr:hypothetical protein PYW07_001738 [Mythimna separata]
MFVQKCHHVSTTSGPDLETYILLQRGVRQGDVIFPKLFTAALEDIFKILEWIGRGINVNGEYIIHLQFADDIIVMAETTEELRTMLSDLSRAFERVGLKMNMDKTKLMVNIHVAPETHTRSYRRLRLGKRSNWVGLTYDSAGRRPGSCTVFSRPTYLSVS